MIYIADDTHGFFEPLMRRFGDNTLESCGCEVDCILTHEAPNAAIIAMGLYPDPRGAELSGYLEWVRREARFKQWLFGHHHIDREFLGGRLRCLYEGVVQLYPN